MATNTGRTPEWAILRSIQEGITASPRLTEGLSAGFCCCAVLEKPAAAPFFTKNGNKTGGLSTTRPKVGFPLGRSKEKGTEIAFRPHFFVRFLHPAAKKNAGPQLPATGLPPSPFVLPEPLCFSCSVFLALLFFVLLFADLAGYSRISRTATRISRPPFFAHPPAVLQVPYSRFPAMPLSGVDRLFCDRINRSSDALFLSCA